MAEHQTDYLAQHRQARDQEVADEVTVLPERDDRAEESHPEEQPARHFFRNDDAGVEGVAQHHIAEHYDHHHRQERRDQDLDQAAKGIDDAAHASSFLWPNASMRILSV